MRTKNDSRFDKNSAVKVFWFSSGKVNQIY